MSYTASAHDPVSSGLRYLPPGGEVYVTSGAVSPRRHHDIYQAQIGYVTQPKLDKRSQHFVSAELRKSGLGISTILRPCRALREYFYRLPDATGDAVQTSYYELLRIPAGASPAELRVAHKLRTLELGTDSRRERRLLERAFNILAQPELRACYDALLVDPESPSLVSLADSLPRGRTIVPQYFSVKRQPWGVGKKTGAAKSRESRTLGETVGTEMTCLRIARGWSQQKLADELGYTERYIGQLERGTKSPTLRTIADIAEAFSTMPSTILRAAERRHRNSGKR